METIKAYTKEYLARQQEIESLQQRLLSHIPELVQKFSLTPTHAERLRDYVSDRLHIFRFYKRAKYDEDKALAKLQSTLEWRITEQIDMIGTEDLHVLTHGLFYFHGKDKMGRPIGVVDVRKYARILKEVPTDEIKKNIVFGAEMQRRITWAYTQEQNLEEGDVLILHCVALVDLKGVGVFTPEMDLGRYLFEVFSRHFPSCIGTIFVLNFNWMFSGVWQIMKSVLPEEARSRIRFVGTAEIYDFIDEKNLLVSMGGKDDYVFDYARDELLTRFGKKPYDPAAAAAVKANGNVPLRPPEEKEALVVTPASAASATLETSLLASFLQEISRVLSFGLFTSSPSPQISPRIIETKHALSGRYYAVSPYLYNRQPLSATRRRLRTLLFTLAHITRSTTAIVRLLWRLSLRGYGAIYWIALMVLFRERILGELAQFFSVLLLRSGVLDMAMRRLLSSKYDKKRRQLR
ncbi:uncharacterized protein VTP21DRAFT_6037 [Calcarisporiella thermophila]|uniref:uncharacterized protein n=1 Tax=Calcarisporiella thermophila TaxID=911321 RepID=UPI0037443589